MAAEAARPGTESWEARTARRPDGWSAEIRIPFRTLNFNPNLDSWGINFQRTIRRRNEEILWRGYRRNEGLRRPVNAGWLTGLRNLSQGLGLEARPSAVASWRNVPGNTDPTTFPRDISLDVNYGVTSSLRAAASINTDFAEVESDQRRVNLTRFPQRFPERRNFLLEGSGVFTFAPRSGPSPFFSRRIGLGSGEQIPIQYGTRLTGQAGRYELGFYQIGTQSHSYLDAGAEADLVIPRESFTVARVKRSILEQSTIGAIYTRRSTAADPSGHTPSDGHTVGLDVQLNTGRFLSYREFGDDYQPSLGFVAKNGFRRWEPRIGWSPRPASIDWIRQFEFAAQFRNLTELGTGHSGGTGVATQPVGRRLAAGSGTGTGPASTCGRRFGPTRA